MCGCGNTGDEAILRNGLAWTLLYHGLPITYYGTEQPAIAGLADQRTAMWPHYGTCSNLISHSSISSSSYTRQGRVLGTCSRPHSILIDTITLSQQQTPRGTKPSHRQAAQLSVSAKAGLVRYGRDGYADVWLADGNQRAEEEVRTGARRYVQIPLSACMVCVHHR